MLQKAFSCVFFYFLSFSFVKKKFSFNLSNVKVDRAPADPLQEGRVSPDDKLQLYADELHSVCITF